MRNDIFINPYKKFSFSGKPFKTLFIEWQKSMILNLVGNHCPFHIKTSSWRTIWQLTVHDSSRNVETVASRGNIILKFILSMSQHTSLSNSSATHLLSENAWWSENENVTCLCLVNYAWSIDLWMSTTSLCIVLSRLKNLHQERFLWKFFSAVFDSCRLNFIPSK